MDIFARIAEERIKEALAKGAFENLRGNGKPLDLDEDTNVPDELRVAYKILKNAGYLPPELELKKEIASLKALIASIDGPEEKAKQLKELNYKLMKFNIMTRRPLRLDDSPEYSEKILHKLME